MRDNSLISTVWHFYLHLCNVMRKTGSTKWHGLKTLCTETKLRKLRVLLVDYYAVKVNSWYTIKTNITSKSKTDLLLQYYVFYWRYARRLKEETLWKRGLLLYYIFILSLYVYIWENYKYFRFTKNVVTNVRFTIILKCDICTTDTLS